VAFAGSHWGDQGIDGTGIGGVGSGSAGAGYSRGVGACEHVEEGDGMVHGVGNFDYHVTRHGVLRERLGERGVGRHIE
jgi:hypothetical protein